MTSYDQKNVKTAFSVLSRGSPLGAPLIHVIGGGTDSSHGLLAPAFSTTLSAEI